jgi:hypothetical protein
MGIYITMGSDSVKFQFSASHDHDRDIAYGNISSVRAWREVGTKIWKLKVSTYSYTFTFEYTDVVSPSTGTAQELANLILAYNSGGGNKTITYATAGQTDVTTTFTLTGSLDVYIGGVLQATGYSWTQGTTTVTFAAPFTGGEEVILIGR